MPWLDQRVVLHVAHRHEAVDPPHAEPVQRVRHQLLEARVLHAGDAFGPLEVGRGRVAALLALARVVDQELGDLAERAAFLAVVDDDAELALLRGAGAFLDAVNEIGPAGADVGAEHVGAVAFVVHAAGDLGARIGQLRHVAEQIDGDAADRRQEHAKVRPRHQLGEHAGGLLEQAPPQRILGGAEALRDAGQIPHRIDRDLDHRHAAVGVDGIAVGLQPPGSQRIAHLDQVEPRPGDRDARADVEAFGDLRLEGVGDQMAPRIERDDLLRLAPLRERADGGGRKRVGQVGPADRIERARRHRERAIERIGAAVGADHVAQAELRDGADDRPALARRRRVPMDREADLRPGIGMRGEADMIRAVRRAHCSQS